MQNYAVIDIGSLKVKLLVAGVEDGTLKVLKKDSKLTLLGKGIKSDAHKVLGKSLQTTIQAINTFKTTCEKHGVTEIKVVATESLRKADNMQYVLDTILLKTGLLPKIISQDEEAETLFNAVFRTFPKNKTFALIDNGGGSVQVLIGKRDQLESKHYLPLGVYYLQQKYVSDNSDNGRPSDAELAKCEAYTEGAFHSSDVPKGQNIPIIYGSSNILDLCNTITVKLITSKYSFDHPSQTTPEQLATFLESIKDMSHIEREKKYPFQYGYMWGIQMAFMNVIQLAKHIGTEEIIPSNVNIAEGYIWEMVEK